MKYELSSTTIDRNKSIGDQVYYLIKNKIITLEFKPMDAIFESKISSNLGVSRTPVRDALKKLQQEGLIKTIPQVKSYVAPINLSIIKESNLIRLAIETKIVEILSKKITKEQTSFLYKIIKKQEKVINQNKLNNFFNLDEEFHKTLAEMADLSIGWDIIKDHKSQIDRARVLCLEIFKKNMKNAFNEHKKILLNISRHNTQKAISALNSHIRGLDIYIKKIDNYNRTKYFVN